MRIGIREVMWAQHVKRWHIIRVGREQSVAEHSFNVTMIALELAHRMRLDSELLHYGIVFAALTHDLEEVFTGDVPTPAKDAGLPGWPAMKFELDAHFAGPALVESRKLIEHIVRVADRIEADAFISMEAFTPRGRWVIGNADRKLELAIREAEADFKSFDWGCAQGILRDILEEPDYDEFK